MPEPSAGVLDEHPAIQYAIRPTTDRVAKLNEVLTRGGRSLQRDPRTGYLRPVLEALGKTIVYVGKAGSGQIAKAAHQLIVAVTIEAVAEALALAKAFGADQERVRDVLLAGLSTSPVLKSRGARMIARDWSPSRPIKHYLKDRANVADGLQGTSLELPLAEAVFERIRDFVESGNGELDDSALYKLLDPD